MLKLQFTNATTTFYYIPICTSTVKYTSIIYQSRSQDILSIKWKRIWSKILKTWFQRILMCFQFIYQFLSRSSQIMHQNMSLHLDWKERMKLLQIWRTTKKLMLSYIRNTSQELSWWLSWGVSGSRIFGLFSQLRSQMHMDSTRDTSDECSWKKMEKYWWKCKVNDVEIKNTSRFLVRCLPSCSVNTQQNSNKDFDTMDDSVKMSMVKHQIFLTYEYEVARHMFEDLW